MRDCDCEKVKAEFRRDDTRDMETGREERVLDEHRRDGDEGVKERGCTLSTSWS